MLSPNSLPSVNAAIDILVADVKVRIDAPESILLVLEATLSTVPRYEARETPDVEISVRSNEDIWEVHGPSGSLKVLAAHSALPQVAGAVVTSVVAHVALTRSFTTMRAAVIERDGRALAFVGDDWESAITLAAHLHGRGWSFLGSDNALLDPVALHVFPVQKSLYVNSSSLAQFPLHYRRAVEASPWYVTTQGISFYAVDPSFAGHAQTWSKSATLEAVVVVDGTINDRASIESVDAAALAGERLARLGIDWSRVTGANLHIGTIVETCDLLEHWFASIRS